MLHCRLSDGTDLECERLLFAGGRAGNTRGLGLERIGAAADARGLLKIDEHFRVAGVAGGRIYAAGDVIGFPALASVAMEQGRVAACHAFGIEYKQKVASQFPYGLYTIPEVSMIGETEESAKKKGIDYEVGRARYGDNARGQIVGDVDRHGEAGVRRAATRSCSACTSSASAPPSWCTSAPRSCTSAGASTTSSSRCSTSRRSARCSSTPPTTGSGRLRARETDQS